MADQAHKETDRMMNKVLDRVRKEYKVANKEIQEKLDDYLQRFATKDKIKQEQVKSGKITQDEYIKWRTGQIMIGKRWEEMRDTIAADYSHANQIAMSIVNGYTPDVYALNHNYGTYEAEKGALVDTSYTLYDRQTVERLIRDNPDLLPKATVDIPKDQRWNKNKVTSAVMQGVIQGEDITKISKRLQQVTNMNETAAVRNARTMTTSAENGGRQDSYTRAESMGIKMKKQWMATLDSTTRDSHAIADGQVVGVKDAFSLMHGELEFPGDPAGPPAEVYNCRCTMVAVVDGVDPSIRPDAVSRNSKLGGMTYDEWKEEHQQRAGAWTARAQESEQTADTAKTETPVRDVRAEEKTAILGSATTTGMTAEQKAEFEGILDGMTDENLHLYSVMAKYHDGNNYVNGGGWYVPIRRRVEMTLSATSWERIMKRPDVGAWKVKFHEEFHQLDNMLGKTAKGEDNTRLNATSTGDRALYPVGEYGPKLKSAIESDIVSLLNKSADMYKDYGAKPVKDLKAIPSDTKNAFWSYLRKQLPDSESRAKASAVTDAIGLATNGRLNTYGHGYWSHKLAYQKDRGIDGATSECFAEIGSHIMRGDIESLDAIRSLMPNTVSAYEEVFHDIASNIDSKNLIK